jgi:hypothetical protein
LEKSQQHNIANNRTIHSTSTRGAQRRAPPQAGQLLVLCFFSIFRGLEILDFPMNFQYFQRISRGGGRGGHP